MAQVGEFSSAVKASNPLDGVEVVLDGVRFRCEGRLSVLALSELAAKAIGRKTADAAEAAAIYETFSLAFGPEEYDRFAEHVREQRTPDEVIIAVLQWLNETVQQNIEAVTARPTKRSSGSPRGPKTKAAPRARSISLGRAAAGGDVVAATPTSPPATKPKATRTRTRATSARRTG